MKFEELKKFAEVFKSAKRLDDLMKPKTRHIVSRTFIITAGILGLLVLLDIISKNSPGIFTQPKFISENIFKFRGAFFIASVLAIKMWLVEMFYYSNISHLNLLTLSEKDTSFYPVTFDVACIIFETEENDVVLGFLNSFLSGVLFDRLNISKDEVDNFISLRKEKIPTSNFSVSSMSSIL